MDEVSIFSIIGPYNQKDAPPFCGEAPEAEMEFKLIYYNDLNVQNKLGFY